MWLRPLRWRLLTQSNVHLWESSFVKWVTDLYVVDWLHRWLSGKESACSVGDTVSIPGLGRSPGDGNGNQYSCLGNPMDTGAWRATVSVSQRVGHDRVSEHARMLLDFLSPSRMSYFCSGFHRLHCFWLSPSCLLTLLLTVTLSQAFWWPWQFWGGPVSYFVDCPSVDTCLMFLLW